MVTDEMAVRAHQILLGGSANEIYFFSKLSAPDWIEPLARLGHFKRPPPAEIEGDVVRCRRWPESQYLVQMAEKAPDLVSRTLCAMDVTDNYFVHDDQIRIAVCMPAPLAAAVVRKRLEEWVTRPFMFGAPRRLAELAVRLGNGGRPGQATEIVRRITALERQSADQHDETDYADRSPRSRLGLNASDFNYMLEAILGGVGSATVTAIGVMTESLASVLDNDADDSWCRDLSHDQSRRYDPRTALLFAMARLSIQVCDADRKDVARLLDQLERHSAHIFLRLRAELLSGYPESQDERISKLIGDPTIVDAIASSYEFSRLVWKCFHIVSDEKKETYLQWLSRKPNLDQIREFHRVFGLPDPKQEEIDQEHREQLRDQLHPLRESLPDQWNTLFEGLVAELGDPRRLRESAPRSEARTVAESSPRDAPSLAALDIDELVTFLRSWEPRPRARVDEPTIGALAKQLEISIASRPEEISRRAAGFKDLDPAYVSATLSALAKAASDGADLDWPAVLELCNWVLDQPTDGVRADISHPYEVSWEWAQGRVGNIFEKALQAEQCPLPIDSRTDVWNVIERLCSHPDPRPQHEEGEDHDYLSMGINSVRGKAIEIVFRYLIWLRKLRDAGDAEISETEETAAWDLLASHLDPSIDPSRSIRAIFGSWTPNLVALSEPWVRANVDTLFPSDMVGLCEAAWSAFIGYTPPYSGVFRLLQAKYQWATDRLDSTDRTDGELSNRLAEHLMVLYGRGEFGVDEELLVSFWSRAPVSVRQHAVAFIGRTLPRDEREAPTEVVERFQSLAEARITALVAQTAAAPVELRELEGFGTLFDNPLLDAKWVLTQLARLLVLTGGRCDQRDEIVKRLATMQEADIPAIVSCLKLMIEDDEDRWWIEPSESFIKRILQRGAAADTVVRQTVESVQSFLVAAGFWEFRTLDQDA